jgi:hypothetical protein
MLNQLEADTQFMLDFAAKHGTTVKYDERYRLWRVYMDRMWMSADPVQLAMCNTQYDAGKVAYALAMVKAGARIA